MPHNYDISSYASLLVPLAAFLTLLVSLRIYPLIIYVVKEKGLMDEPDQRSSHKDTTPTLGGVGMFLSFSVILLLCGIVVEMPKADLIRMISVVAASIILLFLGIKDDLIVLAPKKKFLGQIIAACIVILLTDVRISSFNGILGIGELPYLVSVLFTLCVFIISINAFNLTDGIDGLAGSVACLSSLVFGTYFVITGEIMLALVSLVLVGAIIGFLRYNFSSASKLFMGDSGSLFLGYLLAYQGVCFVEVSTSQPPELALPLAPTLLLALLSYPLVDSLRVFSIRILDGRSPFSPDNNHIHHRFLKVGFSHKRATLAIIASNATLAGLIWLINEWDPTAQFFMGLAAGMVLYLYPFLMTVRRESTQENETLPLWGESEGRTWKEQLQDIPQRRARIFQEIQRPFRADRKPQRAPEPLAERRNATGRSEEEAVSAASKANEKDSLKNTR